MFCFTFLKIPLLITVVSSVYLPQPPGASISTPNKPEGISSSRSERENYQENVQAKSAEKSDWRIVGGRDCSEKEIPFIVSIRGSWDSQHFCAGTLITSRFVLSAANCFWTFSNKVKSLEVVVGASTNQGMKKQIVKIDSVMMHENFDNATMFNDISVIYLAEDVFLTKGSVDVVKLPAGRLPDDLSNTCDPKSFTIAGWGEVRPYAVKKSPPKFEASPQLKCAIVPYIPKTECLKYSTEASNDNVMCAFHAKSGKDACQGDSGGPLVCGGVQYGIISWGKGCGAPDSPWFYTRVDRYLDFINKKKESINTKGCANDELLKFFFSTILLICFFLVKFLN